MIHYTAFYNFAFISIRKSEKMNRNIFPLVILFSLIIIFFSCSSQSRRSRKPVSNITILPKAQNYICENNISVRVETKLKNGEIKNIQLFYQGELIKETKELDFTVSKIELDKPGIKNLRVVATKTDKVSNSRAVTINVVSDIVPEKYTYTTISDYPHNTDFYTQGFIFHDGHIYEGTGEYGKSGIYKTDLATGKILLKKDLPEKYFGEGITILNNKLYQLTYRAQKGYVYDLSNFAVTDSFTYRSKEGWGLTNDGTHLIMSNGTHELIWIDPSDFSEIKKTEVANNQGLINYLNELEFINETIYANVYTTSMIVQIEPETGKVLSEIKLDGILNMYTNPSDTIDYLNGIAYDAQRDRIFITGKWWPRIFQINLLESK
jgi:glutaminyl-peptide cyclotransferase